VPICRNMELYNRISTAAGSSAVAKSHVSAFGTPICNVLGT
jgi:hypothetical protein